jgi:hypothetical protein
MTDNRRTPEEALRIAADAMGGLQEAGFVLRPDVDPTLAGHWLGHCLTATKRDKLALSQIVLLFRRANTIGEHAGFAAFAAACGYAATPITPEAEFAAAIKRADAARREASQAAADLDELSRRPELLARMEAAGLKVGELS